MNLEQKKSFSHCITMYIEKQMGCRLPWNDLQSDFPDDDTYKCNKQDDVKKFLEISSQFHTATNLDIIKLTNCLPTCNFFEHKVLKKYENTILNFFPIEDKNTR